LLRREVLRTRVLCAGFSRRGQPAFFNVSVVERPRPGGGRAALGSLRSAALYPSGAASLATARRMKRQRRYAKACLQPCGSQRRKRAHPTLIRGGGRRSLRSVVGCRGRSHIFRGPARRRLSAYPVRALLLDVTPHLITRSRKAVGGGSLGGVLDSVRGREGKRLLPAKHRLLDGCT